MKNQFWGSMGKMMAFVMVLAMFSACQDNNDTKPEAKVEVKPEPKAEAKVEPKPEMAKPDTKPEPSYKTFTFDNGPDYTQEGLYRIVDVNGKIGYMDSLTAKVVIEPQFGCAHPFEGGKAKVALKCETQKDGEHSIWESNEWYFIDKSGNKVK